MKIGDTIETTLGEIAKVIRVELDGFTVNTFVKGDFKQIIKYGK